MSTSAKASLSELDNHVNDIRFEILTDDDPIICLSLGMRMQVGPLKALLLIRGCVGDRNRFKFCDVMIWWGYDVGKCRDSVRVSVRSHRTSTTSQVRQSSSKKIPVIQDKGTRATHQMRQFLICSWFDNYVWVFFMEEQIDVVFLETTTGQKRTEVSSMVTILHVVDIQSLTRTSVIGKKDMDKHARVSLQSFREELVRQKVALRSECGSTVTALTRETGRRREAENEWTTILERISDRLSRLLGVLEYDLSVQCCA